MVMDYFTKWPEAVPVRNQEAKMVAEILIENIVLIYGVPMELHSDQRRNFKLELFGALMKIFHPQLDGMVECFSKTILDYLSKFMNQNQADCVKKMYMCMLVYRLSMNETMQFTPAKMMMG